MSTIIIELYKQYGVPSCCIFEISPSLRIGQVQLWFEEFDLLVSDHMVQHFSIRQVRVGLVGIFKQFPQCDP